MEKTFTYIYRGQRPRKLLYVLQKEMHFTKKEISRLKWNGKLLVNNKPVYVSDMVNNHETITCIFYEKSDCFHSKSVGSDIDILYEDEDVICVYKHANMTTHPSHNHIETSLGSCVQSYFENKGESFVIRCIGRLDCEVSGVVVYAKNQVAAARLSKEQAIDKTYIALCHGSFEDSKGIFDDPIMKVENQIQRCIDPKGKKAITKYEVIATFDSQWGVVSLVRVKLLTGRTHQIRLHFAYHGHPLINDPLYGIKEDGLQQVGLHCYKVSLVSPFTKEKVSVVAPCSFVKENPNILEQSTHFIKE